jgi:multicomponent Na+:H+ antiporter subunit D
MGAVSTVVGGVMALSQRHLKRLLAFSTISHVGIMLIGLALLSRSGLSGTLVYLVGHGLVKGALFMVAGILLATRGGIDEIGLRGLGAGIRPAGAAMALGGLLLAGLPFGLMDEGTQLIATAAHEAGKPWIEVVTIIGAVCTGGAVLRAAGRIFLGLGPVAGDEEASPTEDEQEKADRPFWLMMLPTGLLLLLSLPGSHAAGHFAWRAAAEFMHPDSSLVLAGVPQATQISVGTMPEPGSSLRPWVSVVLAIALAVANLSRHRTPRWITGALDRVAGPPVSGLRMLHSGLVGDYVMWIMVGLALFTMAFALA